MTVNVTPLPALPSDFTELDVQQAVELLLRTMMNHHQRYFDLHRRHGSLVEWIADEP